MCSKCRIVRTSAPLRAFVAAAMLAGCTVGPQPEPPNLRVESLRFDQDAMELRGEPGAVPAGEGEVWLVDIKGMGGPITEPVRADGSFGPIDWSMRTAGEVLAQVRIGGRPWLPPDVFEEDGAGGARLVVAPFDPCLAIEEVVDFGTVAGADVTRDVEVQNDCAESIDLVNEMPRLGDVAFARVTTLPLTVPSGGRATLTYTLSATATPGLHEEIGVLGVRETGTPGAPGLRFLLLLGDAP